MQLGRGPKIFGGVRSLWTKVKERSLFAHWFLTGDGKVDDVDGVKADPGIEGDKDDNWRISGPISLPALSSFSSGRRRTSVMFQLKKQKSLAWIHDFT